MTQPRIAQLQQNSHAPRWNLGSRVAFRFGFFYLGLFCLSAQVLSGLFPFPNVDIPAVGTLWPMRQITFWVAGHIFHVKLPLAYLTGQQRQDVRLGASVMPTGIVTFPISGSDSGLGFLRKFGADLTGLLRLNCGSCS